VRTPPCAFEKVSCNEVLAEDDEVGQIKCTASSGAYIIMPTANPILGEEAWFWGEPLEGKKEEKKQQVKEPMTVCSIRKSLSNARLPVTVQS